MQRPDGHRTIDIMHVATGMNDQCSAPTDIANAFLMVTKNAECAVMGSHVLQYMIQRRELKFREAMGKGLDAEGSNQVQSVIIFFIICFHGLKSTH